MYDLILREKLASQKVHFIQQKSFATWGEGHWMLLGHGGCQCGHQVKTTHHFQFIGHFTGVNKLKHLNYAWCIPWYQ